MQRQIKFRGQRQSDNKWIYGDLLQPTEIYDGYEISDCESIDGARVDVIEDTIGQYTGLHDKNGKEIYEGDIISNGYEKCIVVWVKEYAGFMLKLINKEYENKEWTNPMIDLGKEDEVIGNIYENPELL